jgi:hypothetical protein
VLVSRWQAARLRTRGERCEDLRPPRVCLRLTNLKIAGSIRGRIAETGARRHYGGIIIAVRVAYHHLGPFHGPVKRRGPRASTPQIAARHHPVPLALLAVHLVSVGNKSTEMRHRGLRSGTRARSRDPGRPRLQTGRSRSLVSRTAWRVSAGQWRSNCHCGADARDFWRARGQDLVPLAHRREDILAGSSYVAARRSRRRSDHAMAPAACRQALYDLGGRALHRVTKSVARWTGVRTRPSGHIQAGHCREVITGMYMVAWALHRASTFRLEVGGTTSPIN